MTSLQAATTLLTQSKHPLLLAHPRPDGDTLGSLLALRLALLALGREPVAACVHPVPANLRFLPGAATFVSTVAAPFDLVVAVDMSDLNRMAGLYDPACRAQAPLLVIDHHETNDHFGDVNVIEPHAVATALPMAQVIAALGAPLTPDIATCLLAGVLTDTRGLRTENTTPAVLSFVAHLVEAGGDYALVMQQALDSLPYAQMRAWGCVLSRLEYAEGFAWAILPLADKLALDIADHDDLDLGNLLIRVAEAQIVAALIEMRDGSIKVSFRARPGYNVAGIAKALGGGGHRQAAGCSIPGPLETALDRVRPYIQHLLSSPSV